MIDKHLTIPITDLDPSLTGIDGNYATLLTSNFSDEAVTSTTFIPESGFLGLGALALVIRPATSRGRK